MNRQIFFRIFTLVICVLIGIIIGQRMLSRHAALKYIPGATGYTKLDLVIDQIKENYVDTVKLDSLIEKSIPKVLGELDPHSVYIPAADMEQANESIEGNFDGIGVMFNMPNDTVVVTNVIGGGPSERAGVQPGDRIITVNDTVIAGKKIHQNNVVKLLRGKTGSRVTIGVQRMEEVQLVQIPITRGKIPVKSVDAAFMLNDNTGYIKLSKFSKTSHLEFLKAALTLQMEGMTNLVFDLRDNTGGLLDQSFEIANEFLEKDQLIVYTEGRSRKRQNFYADGRGHFLKMNVAILTDEGTASASEIVAGALQDNDRGYIVGRPTFGKGWVQDPIYFSDRSGLRFTTTPPPAAPSRNHTTATSTMIRSTGATCKGKCRRKTASNKTPNRYLPHQREKPCTAAAALCPMCLCLAILPVSAPITTNSLTTLAFINMLSIIPIKTGIP